MVTWPLPQRLRIDEEGLGKELIIDQQDGQVQLLVHRWIGANEAEEFPAFAHEIEPKIFALRLVNVLQSFAENFSGTWRTDYHPRDLKYAEARELIKGMG